MSLLFSSPEPQAPNGVFERPGAQALVHRHPLSSHGTLVPPPKQQMGEP
jgi:hypothetical protein